MSEQHPSSQSKPRPWRPAWPATLSGWSAFVRPRFILPRRRQHMVTAFVHFGIGLVALGFSLPRAFSRRRPPANIIFVSRFHLGDFLLALPAIKAARAALPQAKISAVVQETYASHLPLAPLGIAPVTAVDESLPFLLQVEAWRKIFRQSGFDAVVFHRITRPDFPAIIAAWLERIPHRVGGVEKGLQGFLTDIYVPKIRTVVAAYHLDLVTDWLQLPPRPLLVAPLPGSPEPKARRWDLLIAPFAQHSKEWPAENWHALLRYCRDHRLTVALSCSPSDAIRAARLLAEYPEVENLSLHPGSLPDFFQNVREAGGVIALDTGIRHVAAMYGVPCVVIGHGREHFRLFGQYVATERYLFHPVPCAPCGAEPCPLGHLLCVRGISPDSVLQAWKDLTLSSARLAT